MSGENVVLTDQLRYIRGTWRVKDVVDGTDLGNLTMLYHNDGIGKLLGLSMVVRDQHNGNSKATLKLFQGVAQTLAHGGIESVERFI